MKEASFPIFTIIFQVGYQLHCTDEEMNAEVLIYLSKFDRQKQNQDLKPSAPAFVSCAGSSCVLRTMSCNNDCCNNTDSFIQWKELASTAGYFSPSIKILVSTQHLGSTEFPSTLQSSLFPESSSARPPPAFTSFASVQNQGISWHSCPSYAQN